MVRGEEGGWRFGDCTVAGLEEDMAMTRCRLTNQLKRTESPEGPVAAPQDVAIAR